MQDRKSQLLKLVIENYIDTAEPVGSQFIIQHSDLGVSAATVRNDMRELEEEGYLTHPHTSAGRIPTETGYRFYVDSLMTIESPKKKTQELLSGIMNNAAVDPVRRLKDVAKELAPIANAAVIVATDEHRIYYTGLSHLMAQPEFRELEYTLRVSAMFDHCEEVIGELYQAVADGPRVLVGADNPLGSACGTVAMGIGSTSLIAILGPLRMPYSKDVGLLNYIRTIVST